MIKKTAASVLHFVLNQPTLVLILLLVIPIVAFFNGPKMPPILHGKSVQMVQTPQGAAGGICKPGAQRSLCLGSGVGGLPCQFYSCERCGSDGKWWGVGSVSSTPCAVPISHYIAVESSTGSESMLPPWHTTYGDVDEP
jgi:hypothetical protein